MNSNFIENYLGDHAISKTKRLQHVLVLSKSPYLFMFIEIMDKVSSNCTFKLHFYSSSQLASELSKFIDIIFVDIDFASDKDFLEFINSIAQTKLNTKPIVLIKNLRTESKPNEWAEDILSEEILKDDLSVTTLNLLLHNAINKKIRLQTGKNRVIPSVSQQGISNNKNEIQKKTLTYISRPPSAIVKPTIVETAILEKKIASSDEENNVEKKQEQIATLNLKPLIDKISLNPHRSSENKLND